MKRRFIPRKLSRRMLLRGAGVGIALPWLEAMAPRALRAASPVFPRRFGVFFSPCGTIPENWRCAGTETSFTLSRILEPLAPYQQDLVVLRGVNFETANPDVYVSRGLPIPNVHDVGMTHMLAARPAVIGPSGAGRANHFLDGSAGGVSIDQHIANAIGQDTLLPSLELGVECNNTFLEVLVTRMSYREAFQPVQPVDNPVQTYTRLFGSAEQGDSAAMVAALRNRLSVLDHVIDDYTSLSARLGAADRERIEQHLTDVRQIETRLTRLLENPELAQCPGAADVTLIEPALDQCLRDQDLRTPEELENQEPNFCVGNFREVGALQLDLIALAFGCDITRVASMQWSTAESTVRHDAWLDLQFAGTVEHHMLTHNESEEVSEEAAMLDAEQVAIVREDLTKVHHWFSGQFAYLLDKLKSMPEGDGTVLSNSLVFWTNELGEGGEHTYTNIPYVIAGQAGGQLATGRYLDYLGDAQPGYGGPSNNNLFVSFQKLFGIDEDAFGDADFPGELSGLV
ncbi:MAG TPA: DUF1552 domain-containing protein [Polyangiaceae bacterium]